jgi:hypothetical protein
MSLRRGDRVQFDCRGRSIEAAVKMVHHNGDYSVRTLSLDGHAVGAHDLRVRGDRLTLVGKRSEPC